jgi:threonine/homoserine/homoserine lactone efflux protein
MDTTLFLKALLTGFLLSAPIGPVNLICIRYTLLHGRQSGLIAGLGAAAADGIYAFIALLGLSAVSGFIARESVLLRILGGLFIIYLGIRTWGSSSSCPAQNTGTVPCLAGFAKIFFITLANPVGLLAFAAVMATFHISGRGLSFAVPMVAGIVLGAGAWWFILTTLVSLFQGRVTEALLRRVNRVSGMLIIVIGAATVCGVL